MNLIWAAEVHEAGEGIWEEYINLITDPAHLMLELTLIIVIDVIIGMVAWPFIKKWIKEHDRKKHAHQHCDDVNEQGELF
jgi:hypothetical protein